MSTTDVGFTRRSGPVLTFIGPIYLEAIIQAGSAVVANNVMKPGIRVPTDCTLNAVYLNAGTAPTGADLTVVLVKSSDGTTAATCAVTDGTKFGAAEGLLVPLLKHELLTVNVTTIGSTVRGADILVSLEAS